MKRFSLSRFALSILAWSAACCASTAQDKPAEKSPPDPRIMSFITLEIRDGDSELRRLLKQRYNAAGEELRARAMLYGGGRTSLEDLAACVERFTKAGAELAESPVEKVKELELAHNAAQWIEAIVSEKFEHGVESVQAMKHVKVVRYDLEIQLYRARELVKAAASK